jgi:hypothetical protein
VKYAAWLMAVALLPTPVGAKDRQYCNSGPPIECIEGRYNVCLMNTRLVWAKSRLPVVVGTLLYLEIEGPVVAPPCPGSNDPQPVTFCSAPGCSQK